MIKAKSKSTLIRIRRIHAKIQKNKIGTGTNLDKDFKKKIVDTLEKVIKYLKHKQ
tara:strand:- start:96 stop:260 length:165 start_codon:yes stop_codon:yes gene_type:complete